ncbi:MAG: polymer-forming cytoskeletal protein [Thermomicrobiales bacterium]
MVFRKESRTDSFQRQISTLRQQLGSDEDEVDDAEELPTYSAPAEAAARSPLPSLESQRRHQPPRMSDASTGVVSANSSWSGTLRSEGSIQIFGTIEGDLTASDEIYVAEGATVDAHIRARTIIVAGAVTGTIECLGRLEVMPSGSISGDVTSPTLIVHEGATVEGDVKMQSPTPVE